MAGKIIGNQNPVVGIKYEYEVNTLASILMGSFGSSNTTYEWYIYKKGKNGTWKDITQTPKKGIKVLYNFGEISIGIEFRLKVYEVKPGLLPSAESSKTLAGALDIIPASSKTPQIDKVILLNRGSKDVNKANYRDTLIAQAHCIAMFDEEIEFQLWEDDASGGGHNAVVNKNNRNLRTYKAKVNEKGIAETKIPLSSDERILKQIANKYLMKGEKSEGKNHEYYITASYHGKIKGASQVNVDVANPDYKKDSPKSPIPPSKQLPITPKKQEIKKTIPQAQKSQPKENTPKFPATKSSSAPKQTDAQGRITDAYFVNNDGQKLSKVTVGDKIRVRIASSNMKDKHIQYVIWEYDAASHDEIYRSNKIKLSYDLADMPEITITKEMFENGIDVWSDPDKDSQNYFIEVLPLDVSAYSKRFGVDSDGLMEVETVKSVAVVKEKKKDNIKSTCICQEQYKDLIWGGKVSCEFRKKVIQICAELWGDNRKIEMANGLMAVMNVETSSTFKAHQIMGKSLGDINSITKDDFWLIKKDKQGKVISKGSRAVGLIQFTQAALEQIGEFKAGSGFNKLHEVKLHFAKIGEIKQLDYVKKYFESSKDKIKSPEDIYLHVFAPKGVGKDDSYILYDKNIDGEKYGQNKSIDIENNADGKIQRAEILGRYRISFAQGLVNKEKSYTCNVSKERQLLPNKNIDWHDPVDNPMLCLYTQNGNYRPRYNVFGTVRKERTHHNHQGIDLLALPDSNAYACVDAYIEYIQIQSGYGNVICLKVKDPNAFLKRKRDFTLVYKNEGEILHGEGFSFDGDIYLFYAHLKKVLISKTDKEVKCGKVIAHNGTSGYGSSKDPHLHFEIRSSTSGSGLNNRCHPGIFVYYKDENSMTQKEKDYHKEIAQKNWD